jgi:hypothetical protein
MPLRLRRNLTMTVAREGCEVHLGIPVLVKDNIATADNMPTTAGSLALLNSQNRATKCPDRISDQRAPNRPKASMCADLLTASTTGQARSERILSQSVLLFSLVQTFR